ncbi:MAG: hypothetical protein HC907_12445 [Richelia sp. SM1_7_0]|nr:hypothetical protein [Richelia sp. SM1_7_0]
MLPLENINQDLTVPHVIVCGLGNLGQECVKVLTKFGVPVKVIEFNEDFSWEVDGLPDFEIIFGDFRQPDILEKAKVAQCRAVLLVTSDEKLNIEAAFVIRKLNPDVRLVIRSAQENLNKSDSLKLHLNNFVVYDAVDLPARAIATRALNNENRGFFNLESDLLIVSKTLINSRHKWRGKWLFQLNTKDCLVLSHRLAGEPLQKNFTLLEDAKIYEQDEIVYIKLKKGKASEFIQAPQPSYQVKRAYFYLNWKKLWHQVTLYKKSFPHNVLGILESLPQQFSLVVTFAAIFWFVLLIAGCFYLKNVYPKAKPLEVVYATFVMLLGGYNDVFNNIVLEKQAGDKEIQLRLINMLFIPVGLFTWGLANAWLTQWLLDKKFQQLIANPIPKRDHIVVVGLGRQVGRRVVNFLHNWQQSVVGLFDTSSDTSSKNQLLPQVHLVVGDLSNPSTTYSDLNNALAKANLDKAKGIVVVTNDEMLNLEVALKAYKLNPKSALIIRTQDTSFSGCVKKLVPNHAKVLSVYDLAAEVFVATVFVEKVSSLLWLNDQMIFVCEYVIMPDDALDGLELGELTLKYHIITIRHQENMLPSDNIRLRVGDRLDLLDKH